MVLILVFGSLAGKLEETKNLSSRDILIRCVAIVVMFGCMWSVQIFPAML